MTEQYDSTNPKHVKKAKKTAKVIEDRLANGILKICNDRDCRAVLARFFDEAGIFRDTPQIPTPDHAFEHGRNAGRRSMGLWWLEQTLLQDVDIIGKLRADEFSPLADNQGKET